MTGAMQKASANSKGNRIITCAAKRVLKAMDGFRHRCTVILETPEGVLVAAESNGVYCLPGGKIEDGETGEEAVVRELLEETGLEVTETRFLFQYPGRPARLSDGDVVRNMHEVYLVKANGKARPLEEIRSITTYELAKKSGLPLAIDTDEIVELAKASCRKLV